MTHLKGVHFPAKKEDLLAKAKENEAPSEVVDELKKLHATEFHGPQDVMKAYGEEH